MSAVQCTVYSVQCCTVQYTCLGDHSPSGRHNQESDTPRGKGKHRTLDTGSRHRWSLSRCSIGQGLLLSAFVFIKAWKKNYLPLIDFLSVGQLNNRHLAVMVKEDPEKGYI